MAIRPYLISGVALASAGAIVAAMPAVDLSRDIEVRAAVPAPTVKKMSVEQIQLLAIQNITLQAISDAFFDGYGGFVTGDAGDDGVCAEGEDNAVCQAGFAGVPYLFINEILPEEIELDNYFFETGFDGAAKFILTEAGVPEDVVEAVFDPVDELIKPLVVAAAELISPEAAELAGQFFEPGGGFEAVAQAIVNAIIGVLPSAAELVGPLRTAEATPATTAKQDDPGLKKLGTGKLVNLSTNPLSKTVENVQESVGAMDRVDRPEDLTTKWTEKTKKTTEDPKVKLLPRNNDGGANKFSPVILGDEDAGKSRGWNPLRGIEKKLGIGRGAADGVPGKRDRTGSD